MAAEQNILPGQFLIKNDQLFLGCHDGTVEIMEMQIEGKTPQTTKVFLNGNNSLFN